MRLDLHGVGDRKGTVLIVGALLLVMAFGVASVIVALTGSDEMAEGWEEVPFICQKTQEHFTVKYQDLPRDYMEDSALGRKVFLDCPRCGGKSCAAPAVRCRNPDCGKYYPKYFRDAAGKVALHAKCPFCGTVPHEWDRKHRGR